MKFARNLVKISVAAMLLLALVFACGAAAEEEMVEFTIEVSPTTLTAPGKVNVSLKIANPTDQDMSAPVTLYDPAGQVVASFGDGGSYILKSGDSRSWEGEWNVTQAELDAGEITYTLKYTPDGAAETSRSATAKIEYAGERVDLTPQEFTLLHILIENRNVCLSRQKLLSEAWGTDFLGESRTVDVHIQKLRRKLDLDDHIKTIYKNGYRFEE